MNPVRRLFRGVIYECAGPVQLNTVRIVDFETGRVLRVESSFPEALEGLRLFVVLSHVERVLLSPFTLKNRRGNLPTSGPGGLKFGRPAFDCQLEKGHSTGDPIKIGQPT